MNPLKIYLAIPYSDVNKEESFRLANEHAARLMNEGYIVFSPISHSHSIAIQNDIPGTWEFWKEQDEAFIKWCDCMIIVCMEGWEKSKGVKAEFNVATDMKKPVFYREP